MLFGQLTTVSLRNLPAQCAVIARSIQFVLQSSCCVCACVGAACSVLSQVHIKMAITSPTMSAACSVTCTVLFLHLVLICHLQSHHDVRTAQTISLCHCMTRTNININSAQTAATQSRWATSKSSLSLMLLCQLRHGLNQSVLDNSAQTK